MKKNVLLIEDEEELLDTMAMELRDMTQMLIIKAKDGVQAYQKTRNQKFDVIITDWKMPKLMGRQLIDSIRETKGNENTPFIIHTGLIEEAKTQCRGLKGIDFIEKPADFETLSKRAEKLAEFDPDKKEFKLDVDFINPFIDMSMKTLNGLCGVESIKALKPYLMGKEEELEIDISGTLSITSPYFRGSIAVSFANDIYKKILEKMIEEQVAEINADNQDGAAEIVNIIFGNTKAVLNQRGYKIDRALPSVVRGHKHKIYQNGKVPVLLVPFNSDVGRFYIQICVKAI
jgi:chemotaxis protein CheX